VALPIVEEEGAVIAPKPYKMRRTKKRIAVVDTETWGFLTGRVPKPFTLGFWDGEEYRDWWGLDCVDQFFAWLQEETARGVEYLIYAHNGGNFDFFFFLQYLDYDIKPKIIGRRLTKIWFAGQEFRDSFKILPSPLSAYKKDEVDYGWFEPNKYKKHEKKIREYQRMDCVYTRELIMAFHERYGDRLTIGGASIARLNSLYGFAKLSPQEDKRYRAWYHGGRTQPFEAGIRHGKFKIYDVNSMYPFVMATYQHPVGKNVDIGRTIGPDTVLIKVRLRRNSGAFAQRTDTGGLDFTVPRGDFFVTIHEFKMAEELGLISVDKILSTVDCADQTNFHDFVMPTYEHRLDMRAEGNDAEALIDKFDMNNGYGKFGQDPNNFSDYMVLASDEVPEGYPENAFHKIANPGGWKLQERFGSHSIWKKAAASRFSGFNNVMTAASITGAARAYLMQGLSRAVRPVYCDTDSIICESLDMELDGKKLGGWKLEAEGDRIGIAGKKLYALYNQDELVKKASKGAKLTGPQIMAVARGDTVVYAQDVPTFRLNGGGDFVTREIKRTNKIIKPFAYKPRLSELI
jgi:hypothetical protein